MSKDSEKKVESRFKQAGFSDEFVADALRPVIFQPAHTDMGTGHFDFPKHSDLHLDLPFMLEATTDQVSLSSSLELRQAVNEWIRLTSDRISQLEQRIDALETKK